ncbi:MAG: hypothetical protein U1D30_02225 [Planctomycetota bacterium]
MELADHVREDADVVANEICASSSRFRRIAANVLVGLGFVFDLICLLVFLALLAATPVLQFYTLGYMLECAARVARDGRWWHSLPGMHVAGRLGAGMLGTLVIILPLRLVGDQLADARLIDPTSDLVASYGRLYVAMLVIGTAHLLTAWCRGGRFRYFLRPISNARWLVRLLRRQEAFSRPATLADVWARDVNLARAWHFVSLGARGYLGAAVWLFLPTSLLAAGKNQPGVGWLGGILLILVLWYVPFAQVHFAATDRWLAAFDVRFIRAQFRRAPAAHLAAFSLTVILALPLYLLSIEKIPSDVLWMPALLFVATMLPAKIVLGWAYYRAKSREMPASRWLVWPCQLGLLPLSAAYVLFVFFTQYTGWYGAMGLFRHHAFLLPSPF